MQIQHEPIEPAICDGIELTFQNFDLAERCVARSRVRRAGAEYEIRVIVRISPVASQSSLLPVAVEPMQEVEIDHDRAYRSAKRLFQSNICTAISTEG